MEIAWLKSYQLKLLGMITDDAIVVRFLEQDRGRLDGLRLPLMWRITLPHLLRYIAIYGRRGILVADFVSYYFVGERRAWL
jgi:hypothetical protein